MSYPKILQNGDLMEQVDDEIARAESKFKPMANAHEAYAVILEEVDEFWDEVKKQYDQRSKPQMRKELIQVAAMALRTIKDLGL